MKAHTAVPFVDTTIVPDRNAGIGSLLWDLQHPTDLDGPPLLDAEFAFIDVGVSRARVSTALKTLLAGDLKMDVVYVSTERPEAVPYAIVTLLGDRADKIRACLSRMISSKPSTREVTDWHLVIDRAGKVSSVAYSYDLLGNEIWESYFMGRPFIYSGERVEFSAPELDEALASDVSEIETRIALGPSCDRYRIERNPLETRLAACGISLQTTDVPHRVTGRQNVLFLGNVLNHYPQEDQARGLDGIAARMEAGDIVIIQTDDTETPSIEVLHVKADGAKKTRERLRWINTRTLDIQMPPRGSGPWRQIHVKPAVDRLASRFIECLESSPEWSRDLHQALRQRIHQVFRASFRALPVEETLGIAIREAMRRVPSCQQQTLSTSANPGPCDEAAGIRSHAAGTAVGIADVRADETPYG